MKRILALFIAALFLFTALMFTVSCGDNGGEATKAPETTKAPNTTKPEDTTKTPDTTKSSDETTKAPDATTAPSETDASATTAPGETKPSGGGQSGYEKRADYQDANFGGYEFRIAAYVDASAPDGWGCKNDVYAETDTTKAIGKAVLERNAIVEKLYNCKITTTLTESGYGLTNADVTGNTNNYELGSGQYPFNGFSYQNYYNVYSLDLDLDQPWWDQNLLRDCSFKDSNGVKKLYYLGGAMTMSAYTAAWCMFINLDVLEQSPITDDIFSLILEGKWTMDKLIEYVTVAAKDSDGDQVFNANNGDILGMCCYPAFTVSGMFIGGGGSYTGVDDEGKLYYNFGSGIQDDVVEKIAQVYATPGFDAKTGYSTAHTFFKDNKSLFLSEVFGTLASMEDVENLRASPIPMPKYTEDQEYATYVNNKAAFFAVPISIKNVQQVSDFVELFCYHAYKIVFPEFENTYKYSYSSSDAAEKMVDIIFASRRFEIGYYLNFQVHSALSADILAGKSTISKMAKANKNTCEGVLTSFITTLTKGH